MNDVDWILIARFLFQAIIVGGFAYQVAQFVNYFDSNKLDKPMSSYFIEDGLYD